MTKMYLNVYIYDRADFNQWGFKLLRRELAFHNAKIDTLVGKDLLILKMDGTEITVEAKDVMYAETQRGEYGNIPNTVSVAAGDLIRIEIDLD